MSHYEISGPNSDQIGTTYLDTEIVSQMITDDGMNYEAIPYFLESGELNIPLIKEKISNL